MGDGSRSGLRKHRRTVPLLQDGRSVDHAGRVIAAAGIAGWRRDDAVRGGRGGVRGLRVECSQGLALGRTTAAAVHIVLREVALRRRGRWRQQMINAHGPWISSFARSLVRSFSLVVFSLILDPPGQVARLMYGRGP